MFDPLARPFDALSAWLADAASPVLDSPKPRPRLRRFGDSALECEPLCRVASPTRAAKATHRLSRTVDGAPTAEGIGISYPKRDVTVRDAGAETAGAAAAVDPSAASGSGPDPDDAAAGGGRGAAP